MNKLLYRVFVYMLVAISVSLILLGSVQSSILNDGSFMGFEVLDAREMSVFYSLINDYTDIRYFTDNQMYYELMKVDIGTLQESNQMKMNYIVAIYDENGNWALGSDESVDLAEAKRYLKDSEQPVKRFIIPLKLPSKHFILAAQTKDEKNVNYVINWTGDSYNVLEKYTHVIHRINMAAIFISLLLTFVPVVISLGFGYLLPLKRLRRAADSIAAGELDFSIKSQGLDEIKVLSKSFEDMRYELEESRKREQLLKEGHRQLITNMSHDLRTPITSIKGYVEGLMDGKGTTPERMERYLKTIQSKTLYLDAMINDLFQFSQLDLGEYPLERKLWKSTEVINHLAEPIQLWIEHGGWTFELKKPVAVALLYVDITRLAQVVENVVQNSLKYTEGSGHLSFETFIRNHYFAIAIRDNGIGIDADSLPYIFEAFYREDNSRSHQVGGSGLGLAICKKIVELHDGYIDVMSQPTKGTCITIYLPLKTKKENKSEF